jgi:3-deoxy-D-arabino-heptulosonate 7-phosphate (DAHP) synthase
VGIQFGAAHGIVEIHHEPEKEASYGQQTLNFEEFDGLMRKFKSMETVFS